VDRTALSVDACETHMLRCDDASDHYMLWFGA
jgi:hypothetical protein